MDPFHISYNNKKNTFNNGDNDGLKNVKCKQTLTIVATCMNSTLNFPSTHW